MKAYLLKNILGTDDEESHNQWMDVEKVISEYGSGDERQGFIYGFQLRKVAAYDVVFGIPERKRCV